MWEALVPARPTVTGADRLSSKASKDAALLREVGRLTGMLKSPERCWPLNQPGVKSKPDIRES